MTEEQNRSLILIYFTVLPKLGKTSAGVLKILERADMKRPSSFYQSGDKTVIRNTLNMLTVKEEDFTFGGDHKLGLTFVEGTSPG